MGKENPHWTQCKSGATRKLWWVNETQSNPCGTYYKSATELYITSGELQTNRRISWHINMSLTLTCVCPSGDLVLARYTLDENWYRGRVLSIVTDDENTPSQKAEVFYVDYGNTEMMPFNRLVAMTILHKLCILSLLSMCVSSMFLSLLDCRPP